MLSNTIHRKILIAGSIVLVSSLALSPFLVSISQLLLALNWLAEKNLKNRVDLIFKRKSLLLVLVVYLIHILWLINSKDLIFGLHDLKIKLPLLVLPIIYGTSLPLNRKEIGLILHFFIVSLISAIVISTSIYLGLTSIRLIDIREISPIISHIRLSLLIVLAFYTMLYFVFFETKGSFWPRWLYFTIMFIFLLFIGVLGATTGLAVLILVFPPAFIYWLKTQNQGFIITLGILGLSILLLCTASYLLKTYTRFMQRDPLSVEFLPGKTINGNPYRHDVNQLEYENQYLVWTQICEKELEKEWNKKSKINYRGNDLKGQFIRSTLIRYLTSLGYTKDSVGIAKLALEDIEMIEKGSTNYLFKKQWGLYPRLYPIYWEIEHYIKGGNPSGHSLTQRIEYLKNSLHVTKRNFWLGTGIGDTDLETKRQYILDNSKIIPAWQYRAHNQFLTLLMTFGIFGFLFIIASMTMALYMERQNIDFLFFCFILIFLASTITEDTLETQIGATLYAFFLSVLLLGRNVRANNNSQE